MSPSNHSQELPTRRKYRNRSSTKNNSVHFSPQVSLRIVSSSSSLSPYLSSNGDNSNNAIINKHNPIYDYSAWHSINEIKAMKWRAKSLAKLHYRLHNNESNNNNNSSNTNASNTANHNNIGTDDIPPKQHPSTYELNGESLRGMEYLTDLNSGRRRQFIKSRAIASVVVEFQGHQQQKHEKHDDDYEEDHELGDDDGYSYLRNTDSTKNGENNEVIENHEKTTARTTKTTSSMAREYSKKCQPALKYSQRSAEVDACEAAAILEQDLTLNTTMFCANQSFNAFNSFKPPFTMSCCPSPQSVLSKMMLKIQHQEQLLQHQKRVALLLNSGNYCYANNMKTTASTDTISAGRNVVMSPNSQALVSSPEATIRAARAC